MRASRYLLLPLMGLLAGCSLSDRSDADYRPYPYELAQAETLDIQVFLNPTTIEFTNTTARAFGASRVWLNQRYSREINGLDVGETKVLSLGEFRDRFGDEFPGSGFFATERPERLVLAQLETEQPDALGVSARVLLGLVAIAEGDRLTN
ncbi:MAG: hypothetical protein AAGB51_03660 [Planctomycetota bacterium]